MSGFRSIYNERGDRATVYENDGKPDRILQLLGSRTENPYQAPMEDSGQSGAAATSGGHQSRRLGSRLSILFVAFVFGAISAFSLMGFLYNLTINYPGTERPVIEVDPLWMFGHVIRGLGLGALTWFLLRYQSEIKNWPGSLGQDAERLVAIHDAAWKAGAIVLGALMAFGIAYAIHGRPSL
jgi:hypothetical protein